MRASRSSLRGPLIFAALLVVAHSILVLRIAYIVSHSHGHELGMYWVTPLALDIPTSFLIADRISSNLYVPAFLAIGLLHWGVIGFIVGWIVQSLWRRRRRYGVPNTNNAA
jgi:hypothetical protein